MGNTVNTERNTRYKALRRTYVQGLVRVIVPFVGKKSIEEYVNRRCDGGKEE